MEAQENRRMLQSKLSDIKQQLETVHDEIMNTPRNDRYLELIKRDLQVSQNFIPLPCCTERHKKKNKFHFPLQLRATDTDITEKFRWAESFERELFTHLTAAVKLSHEKEQVYATTTKYWSVIASIIGKRISHPTPQPNFHFSFTMQERYSAYWAPC